jgi:pyruvate dehydrogenase E2 component (dihydrolipoamide acetyltransferase)
MACRLNTHAPAAVPGQDTEEPLASLPVHAPPGEFVRKNVALDSFEEIPQDSMRKTIARGLAEASRTIPHFYHTADILESVRKVHL